MELSNEQQQLIAIGAQVARDDERATVGQRIGKLIEAAKSNGMPPAFIAGLETALEVITHSSSNDLASKDVE